MAAVALLGGILKLGPVELVGPRPLAALLASVEGVFLEAGLIGPDWLLDGIDRLGLLPAKVDSLGFRDQENMSEPGIFHPLLQPVCVPVTTTTTTASRVQFASFIRMANNSLW